MGSILLVKDWAELNFSLIKRTNSKSRRLIRLYVSLLMNGETVGLWHKRKRLPMYSIGAIIWFVTFWCWGSYSWPVAFLSTQLDMTINLLVIWGLTVPTPYRLLLIYGWRDFWPCSCSDMVLIGHYGVSHVHIFLRCHRFLCSFVSDGRIAHLWPMSLLFVIRRLCIFSFLWKVYKTVFFF